MMLLVWIATCLKQDLVDDVLQLNWKLGERSPRFNFWKRVLLVENRFENFRTGTEGRRGEMSCRTSSLRKKFKDFLIVGDDEMKIVKVYKKKWYTIPLDSG